MIREESDEQTWLCEGTRDLAVKVRASLLLTQAEGDRGGGDTAGKIRFIYHSVVTSSKPILGHLLMPTVDNKRKLKS